MHTPTQKPLRAMIPELIQYVKTQQRNQVIYERKVLDIFEGGLQKYVEDSIRTEYSANTAATAIERIAPINILPKVIDKISAVYTHGVTRISTDKNEIDDGLIGFYEKAYTLDSKMNMANQLVNLFQYLALEPYIDNGEPKLRILPPTDFTVYSDSFINTTDPTVFIKYMGQIQPTNEPSTDTDGRSLRNANEVVDDIALFIFYSTTEIIAVDAQGAIRHDVMAAMGNPEGINPLGRIPFVYVNTSEFTLVPAPRQDRLTMPILIPKLLTDLNYAIKFQSHAILYSVDLNMEGLQNAPDAVWELQSTSPENTGSLNTIKPEVDVEKVLSLISSTMSMWLESLGVKSAGIGGISTESAQSGIAKAIDESDSTNIRNDQKKVFAGVEGDLWDLTADLNAHWIATGELQDSTGFSEDFDPVVIFEDAAVLVDEKVRLETLKMKLESGFTTQRRAIAEANPEMSAEEVTELMAEIATEKAERVAMATDMFGDTETSDDSEDEE